MVGTVSRSATDIITTFSMPVAGYRCQGQLTRTAFRSHGVHSLQSLCAAQQRRRSGDGSGQNWKHGKRKGLIPYARGGGGATGGSGADFFFPQPRRLEVSMRPITRE